MKFSYTLLEGVSKVVEEGHQQLSQSVNEDAVYGTAPALASALSICITKKQSNASINVHIYELYTYFSNVQRALE